MSPKPSKKRSRGGAASTTTEEPTPTEELAPTEEPTRRVSFSWSKRPAEETPQRQGAQFEAPEETPIQHHTKRRRRFSRRVAVNPNDFSTELTDDEKAALYALIKRSQRTDEFGVATFQIPPYVRMGSKPLTLAVVAQRESQDLGDRQQRNHARATEYYLVHSGGGDLAQGLTLLGKRDSVAFEKAAANLNLRLLKRMDAKVGLELMTDLGLTWQQYRKLNSALISHVGTAVVAAESAMRRDVQAHDPVSLQYGTAELQTNKGGGFAAAEFCRAESLLESYENQSAAVWRAKQVRDDLDTIPDSAKSSPFDGAWVSKFMGDKGGGSTKWGFVLVNQTLANDGAKFNVLCDFAAADNHDNLKSMVFDYYNPELSGLRTSCTVFVQSGENVAVKFLPSCCPFTTTTIRLPPPPAPATPSASAEHSASAEPSSSAIRIVDVGGLVLPTSTTVADPDLDVDNVTWALLRRGGGVVGVGVYGDGAAGRTLVAFFEFRRPLELGAGATLSVTVKTSLVFMAGDYAWYCTMLGHQGSSAMFPCIYCTASDHPQIQQCKYANLQEKPELRTVKLTHEHYAVYERSEKKNAKAAQRAFSIEKAPLVPGHCWQMEYLAPMILHLFLGTIVKLYDLLVNDVRAIDGMDAEAVERQAAMKDATDFLSGLQCDLENAIAVVADETAAQARFKSQAKTLLKNNRIDISQANAAVKGISEADYADAQVARRLEKEAAAVVAEAKAEVKALEEEIKLYQERIESLKEVSAKPGALEKSLENHLQQTKVSARSLLHSQPLASHVGPAASLLQRRVCGQPRPIGAELRSPHVGRAPCCCQRRQSRRRRDSH